ncbi:MAG: recombinase family protein, partial [Actinomycetes bacterium]
MGQLPRSPPPRRRARGHPAVPDGPLGAPPHRDRRAALQERGIDLVVLKQGTGTTTPAGRFTFHVLAAMDEMLADLISEGTREGLEVARARGRVGGRKPKLTARQAEVARGMYDETGDDGRRKYTVAEIAGTFGVSRKTVYRHLEPSDGRRQPGTS